MRSAHSAPLDTPSLGGWCTVHRKDRAITKRVSLSEYSTGKSLWATKPGTMIEKVAITQAHRDAFPSIFAGTYGEEELG